MTTPYTLAINVTNVSEKVRKCSDFDVEILDSGGKRFYKFTCSSVMLFRNEEETYLNRRLLLSDNDVIFLTKVNYCISRLLPSHRPILSLYLG